MPVQCHWCRGRQTIRNTKMSPCHPTVAGRLFQTRGPATENNRSPIATQMSWSKIFITVVIS